MASASATSWDAGGTQKYVTQEFVRCSIEFGWLNEGTGECGVLPKNTQLLRLNHIILNPSLFLHDGWEQELL